MNEEFTIPAGAVPPVQSSIAPDVAATLRAKAAALVAAESDEAALLARFVSEIRAQRESKIRAEALVLADAKPDADAHGFPKKYVELMIFHGDAKELAYVPLGVNGFICKVQRGEKVILNSVFLEVLEHAVTEVVIQHEGGLITRPKHQYQFNVTRHDVPEPEYLAFKAKMKEAGAKAAVV